MSHGLDLGEFAAQFDDVQALNDVFSAAYEELRRLAASVRRNDPSATLSPTALVNEAWLKLADSPWVARTSRVHFKRIAARAMRQVLIEAARRSSRSTNHWALRTAAPTTYLRSTKH